MSDAAGSVGGEPGAQSSGVGIGDWVDAAVAEAEAEAILDAIR